MSTNKSDLGSTAGMSMSGSSNTFNMSNYHARSNSDMNIHHPYTYGPTAYHAHSLDSTANQIMFVSLRIVTTSRLESASMLIRVGPPFLG